MTFNFEMITDITSPLLTIHTINECIFIFCIVLMQLMNRSMVSAPTVERAATLLDSALTSRGGNRPGSSSHMFFTLHVRQQPTQGSTKDLSEYRSLAHSLARPLWHLMQSAIPADPLGCFERRRLQASYSC